MRSALALIALLGLAACQSDSDPGPGEVTRGEARQLNEAASATDLNTAMAEPDNSAQ